MPITDGQNFALNQLQRIASAEKSSLRIRNEHKETDRDGWLMVDISLDCSRYEHREGGLELHSRENVRVYIPDEFPHVLPYVETVHTRFKDYPHVQWGRQLCLYQSPDTQWEPGLGMIGFVKQLADWFEKAARGELDDPEGPLHPPVAYGAQNAPAVVVHSDTPGRDRWPWFGIASFSRSSRANVIEIHDWLPVRRLRLDKSFAVVFLLDFELSFEYPQTVNCLLDCLKARGVNMTFLLFHLMIVAECLRQKEPLYVVIGAPSRGPAGSMEQRLQHLQVWEIPPSHAGTLGYCSRSFCKLFSLYRGQDPPKTQKLREQLPDVFNMVQKWQENAEINWCHVMENRPEIIQRRDLDTPMDAMRGKSVALFGCGALGSAVAEYLVRGGVKRLSLYDKAFVSPGILVRQNYERSDVGLPKVKALRRRLNAIRTDCEIVVYRENIIEKTLRGTQFADGIDLVIDATASLRVRHRFEELRKTERLPVPAAAMMVSAAARHGAWVLAPAGYSGGTLDVYRRLGLAAANREWMKHWTDAFWNPDTAEVGRQPEPGCSAPTFVGSHADVAGLVARMFNHVAVCLRDAGDSARGGLLDREAASHPDFVASFSPDIVVTGGDWEFRVAEGAWRDSGGWIRAGWRERTAEDETGGILFGQLDEFLRVAWISAVSGPPEDSEFSPLLFTCGVEGIKDLGEHYSAHTSGAVGYLGTWHSHPMSSSKPSPTDFKGIAGIFGETPTGGIHQVMMIVGRAADKAPELGLYLFEKQKMNGLGDLNKLTMIGCGGSVKAPLPRPYPFSMGLALSGGGSRAIAFHLGTLRALEDLGLLDDVKVISGVSGGAVTTGLVGYSQDPFASIDALTVKTLRRGLLKPSLLKLLNPKRLVPALFNWFFVAVPSLFLFLIRLSLNQGAGLMPERMRGCRKYIDRLQWPFSRRCSRTHALADAVADIVGDGTCAAPTRQNKDVVLNACELRTGTAFRVSNERFGSWRFGYAPASDLRLAEAVTASAAYPPLVPPYDWKHVFQRNGESRQERVIVTDGGVFENLGVSVMEPGRDTKVSGISYSPEVIITSDAGVGQFSGGDLPSTWPERMVQAVNSIMRKVNDATKKRLHDCARRGELNRFVYVNLGQKDEKVPFKSPGWVDREAVIDYPTDFNAMSQKDLNLLSNRAETLTRSLITQYLLSD